MIKKRHQRAALRASRVTSGRVESRPQITRQAFEDICSTKTKNHGAVLLGDVIVGFVVFLVLDADDGSEDADPFLALLDVAAKVFPAVEPGHAGRAGMLQSTHTLRMFH